MSTVVRQIRYHAPALHTYVEVRVMGSSTDISTDERTYVYSACGFAFASASYVGVVRGTGRQRQGEHEVDSVLDQIRCADDDECHP